MIRMVEPAFVEHIARLSSQHISTFPEAISSCTVASPKPPQRLAHRLEQVAGKEEERSMEVARNMGEVVESMEELAQSMEEVAQNMEEVVESMEEGPCMVRKC